VHWPVKYRLLCSISDINLQLTVTLALTFHSVVCHFWLLAGMCEIRTTSRESVEMKKRLLRRRRHDRSALPLL